MQRYYTWGHEPQTHMSAMLEAHRSTRTQFLGREKKKKKLVVTTDFYHGQIPTSNTCFKKS